MTSTEVIKFTKNDTDNTDPSTPHPHGVHVSVSCGRQQQSKVIPSYALLEAVRRDPVASLEEDGQAVDPEVESKTCDSTDNLVKNNMTRLKNVMLTHVLQHTGTHAIVKSRKQFKCEGR
jgi:hypothetical protein